jgi:hypothetical protein
MARSKTPAGRAFEVNEATVTTNGSGTGSTAVVFTESFIGAPSVMVITQAGDSGTFAAASITEAGFTLNVTTSLRVSTRIAVTWFACVKA